MRHSKYIFLLCFLFAVTIELLVCPIAIAQLKYKIEEPAIELNLGVLNKIDPPPKNDEDRYKIPSFERKTSSPINMKEPLPPEPVEAITLTPPPGYSAIETSEPLVKLTPPKSLEQVILSSPPPLPPLKPGKESITQAIETTKQIETIEDIAKRLDVVEKPKPIGGGILAEKKQQQRVKEKKEKAPIKHINNSINIDKPPLKNKSASSKKVMSSRPRDINAKYNSDYQAIMKDPLMVRLNNMSVEDILESIDPDATKVERRRKPESNILKQTISDPQGDMIRVIFTPKQSKITSSDLSTFLSLARNKILENPNARIEIRTYAQGDNIQSNARRLSLARALSLRDALIADRINARLIDLRPMGIDNTRYPPERADIFFITGN